MGMKPVKRERYERVYQRTLTSVLVLCFILYFIAPYTAVSQESNDVLRVGMYENPPKIFTDEEGNEQGIFPAIIEYIAEQEGWTVEYVHGSFSQGLSRLRNGEIDIMQDVAWSEERDTVYAFNDETVVLDWGRLYAAHGVDIQTFLDLEGKRIAVMEDGIYNIGPEGVKALMEECELNATYIQYPGYHDIFKALEDGEADVGAVNRFFGKRFESDYGVDSTPMFFTPISIRFALDANNPDSADRISRIDQHLSEMKSDPDSIYYQAIDEFIGGHAERGTVEVFPIWAGYLMFIVAGGIVLLFGVNIVLKKKVNRRTSELREDIRKRKGVENELREHREELEEKVNKRTEELQESLDELKTFTYSVSHDLKAPVRSMQAFSGILLDEFGDELDDTGVEYLERINSSAKNMNILISDLLRYGHLTHEEMELERVSLQDVVEEVISDLKDEIESTEAIVKVSGRSSDVRANRMILKQCISNLLGNAIKFVEEERVPDIEINTKDVDGYARLEVKDNGIGIDKEYNDKIFRVFERLHGREVYSGTGVGLAIVKKEQSGWEVKLESNRNRARAAFFGYYYRRGRKTDERRNDTVGRGRLKRCTSR